MLISYNWLQTYFKKKLPVAGKVAEILTFTVFEVESVEKKENDFILDVKVLPDRACYALSHRGIARELAAALTWELNSQVSRVKISQAKLTPLSIKIENPADCRRYIGRKVSSVDIRCLQKNQMGMYLGAIGQKSINNVVDAANFVMFDMGQPLHAFDADKVKGGITVRRAKEGEKITTLDGKDVSLDSEILVIADDAGPLAIAGIKGGKRAEVTGETKNLILESANFNPALIRRASERLGIRTDASKHFENNPTPEFCGVALEEFSALLAESIPESTFGEAVDVYPNPEEPRVIMVSADFIQEMLGVSITEEGILEILGRLNIKSEKRGNELSLHIPPERCDLVIPEDIVEEVGRLYGYSKIIPVKISPQKVEPLANTRFNLEFRVREFLEGRGFSEIITSSFSEKGEIEVMKPIDSTRPFFRTELSGVLKTALDKNILNADLLGLDKIKIFEIGKVFSDGKEFTSLCAGIAYARKKRGERVNDEIKVVRDELFREFGGTVSVVCVDDGGILLIDNKPIGEINKVDGIMEINLDALTETLPESEGVKGRLNLPLKEGLALKPFSDFPFIARDIAFFVTDEVGESEARKTLNKILRTHPGALLVAGPRFFDQFEKNGKKSFAYRMVFQSFKRTLTDEEVNKIMEKVMAELSKLGWQVR